MCFSEGSELGQRIEKNPGGYLAYGANAFAWHAAIGMHVVAHDFAVGIHACAPNANNRAAHAVIANLTFVKISRFLGSTNSCGKSSGFPSCSTSGNSSESVVRCDKVLRPDPGGLSSDLQSNLSDDGRFALGP